MPWPTTINVFRAAIDRSESTLRGLAVARRSTARDAYRNGGVRRSCGRRNAMFTVNGALRHAHARTLRLVPDATSALHAQATRVSW
jgi:hypothetical protein